MRKMLVALLVVGFVFSLAVVSSSAEEIQFKTYIVKAGDTLGEIAYTLEVKPAQLLEWNQGLGTALQIGQEIKYLSPKDVNQVVVQRLGEMTQGIRDLKGEVVTEVQQKMGESQSSQQTFYQSLLEEMNRKGKKDFYLSVFYLFLIVAAGTCLVVFSSRLLKLLRSRHPTSKIEFRVDGQRFILEVPVDKDGKLGSLSIDQKGERRYYLNARELARSLKKTIGDYLTGKRGDYTLLESAIACGALEDLDGAGVQRGKVDVCNTINTPPSPSPS